MAEKITVPTLGESVTEATVSKWLKSQGDEVVADEPLVELETDKVNVEVPAPGNGILSNIAVKEGETVSVGSLLGTINGARASKPEVKEIKNDKTVGNDDVGNSCSLPLPQDRDSVRISLCVPVELFVLSNHKVHGSASHLLYGLRT